MDQVAQLFAVLDSQHEPIAEPHHHVDLQAQLLALHERCRKELRRLKLSPTAALPEWRPPDLVEATNTSALGVEWIDCAARVRRAGHMLDEMARSRGWAGDRYVV